MDNGRTIDKVFSATLPLLDCPVYRQSILQGLLSQFGQAEFLSPTSMTIDLQDYLKSTAPSARQPLVDDLLRMVSANDSAQAVPACYLLAILARSDLLDLSQLLSVAYDPLWYILLTLATIESTSLARQVMFSNRRRRGRESPCSVHLLLCQSPRSSPRF